MMELDDDLVRRLAGLLDETGLTELEIAEGERRIRIARAGVPVALAPPAAAAPAAPESVEAPAPVDHPGQIKAPMVGTVYVAPEPGAAPFVRQGEQVAEGATLLIIEAMKVMNPIRAPRAGTVTRILIDNGQPVEFGEPLMIIE